MKKKYFKRKPFLSIVFRISLPLILVGCAANPGPLSFQANRKLIKADHQKKSSQDIAFYLSAAQQALAVITDKNASFQQQAESTKIYNNAVGECVVALKEEYSQTEEQNLILDREN